MFLKTIFRLADLGRAAYRRQIMAGSFDQVKYG